MLHLELLEPRCLLSISFNATTLDFDDPITDEGITGVGYQSDPQTLTITNPGLTPATITDIQLNANAQNSFVFDSTNGTNFVLAPQASADVQVWFTPQQPGPVLDANMVVVAGTPYKITLDGQGVPGDLVITDLSFPAVSNPDSVWTGEPLDVAGTIENIGIGDINSDFTIGYYISEDDNFDANDVLTDTDTVSAPLVAGAGTNFTHSVDIPVNLNGTYYILAKIDPDNVTAETNKDNNVLAGEEMTFQPHGVEITDSVNPDDDFLVDFQDPVIVGEMSDEPEFIYLENSGDINIRINPEITGEYADSFSLTPLQATPHAPAGFDPNTAIQIEIGTLYTDGQWDIPGQNIQWFYFDAPVNHRIDIETSDNDVQIHNVILYDSYGNLVAEGKDYVGWHLEYIDAFATLYTGRYYLLVSGWNHAQQVEGGYDILLSSVELVGDLALPHFDLPEEGDFFSFSDTLALKDKERTEPAHDTNWIQFETQENAYGTVIELGLTADKLLDIEIFDANGTPILTEVYDNVNNEENFELVLYGDGLYTIVVQTQFDDSNDDPGSANFDLTVTNVRSILDLVPGGQSELPVWFAPQTVGDLEAFLEIDLVSDNQEINSQEKLTLNGTCPPAPPGDLYIADVVFTSIITPKANNMAEVPQVIPTGAPLEVTVIVGNHGPGNVYQKPHVNFYLSSDDVLDDTDTLLDKLTIESMIRADNWATVNANIALPGDLTGEYFVLAWIDPDNLIVETDEDNNSYISDRVTFGSGIVVLDSTVPGNDFILTSPDTPAGNSSSEQYVYLFNIGDDPVVINNLDLSGENYSLEYGNTLQRPHRYDSEENSLRFIPFDGVNPITVNAVLDSEQYVEWFYFDAQEDSLVTVQTEYWDSVIRIYSRYGEEITGFDQGNQFYSSYREGYQTFAAPYTGLYYVEVDDLYGNTELTVSRSRRDLQEIPLSENSSTVIGQVLNKTSVSQGDTLNAENFFHWYSIDAQYGSEISIETETSHWDSTIGVSLYNEFGELLLNETYQDDSLYNLTLYAAGSYYLGVECPDLWTDSDEPVDYKLTVTQTGSLTELAPGETAEIPVWFTPRQTGDIEETLTLETNLGTSDTVTLQGVGTPGDMTLTAIAFPELTHPKFVQSGKPLTVVIEAQNLGPAHILNPYDINYAFYLSTDEVWDGGDILLSQSDTELEFTLGEERIYPGESTTITGTVQIPQVTQGDYYIIARANPDQLLDELIYNNNDRITESIFVDPYSTIVFDSVGDSEEEKFDGKLDFGQSVIGRFFPTEFVTVFNRGEETVNITEMYLGNGENSGYRLEITDPTFELQPNQGRNIHVTFIPESFNPGNDPLITDTLTVLTSEDKEYMFELSGKVTGPSLEITEQSGTANDDKLEFGAIQAGRTSEPIIFTLTNNGNHDLLVNDIGFENNGNGPFDFSPGFVNEQFTLTAGSSHEVSVVFESNFSGSFTDKLIINSTDRTEKYTYTLELSASAVRANLSIFENSDLSNDNILAYGQHKVNPEEPVIETVELANTGEYELTVHGWSITGLDPEDFAINIVNDPDNSGDDISIPVGQSRFLEVEFLAQAERYSNAILNIVTDIGNYSLELIGNAKQPGATIQTRTDELHIDLGSVTYEHHADQTTSTDSFLIIPNEVDLFLSSVSVTGDGFTLSADGAVLEPDGSLSFDQTISPPNAVRVYVTFDASVMDISEFQDISSIDYQGQVLVNGDIETIALDLSATVNAPEIHMPATSVVFDATNIGGKSSETIEISNPGAADLVVRDWAFVDAGGQVTAATEQFELNLNGDLIVPPGQSREVEVFYRPKLVGSVEAFLQLNNNDLDEYNTTIVGLEAESEGRKIFINSNFNYPFYDENGDQVTIKIDNGSGLLYLNNGAANGADIARLILQNTNSKTKLKISTNGETTIGDLIVEGSINSIQAPQVTINNSIDIDGSLNSLKLNNIENNVQVNLAQSSSRPMTIQAREIGNAVNFGLTDSRIKTFQAKSYAGGSVQASQINKINISAGNLGADFATSAGDIRQVNVRGNIDGVIQAQTDIGKVISKSGAINGMVVAETGDIALVQAKNGITGMVLAQENIKTINVEKGVLSGSIRAQSIKNINALVMDESMVSVADSIGTVKVKTDVIDSYVLAGYDIGLDGMVGAGDPGLVGGQLGSFRFGGDYRNSHVAIGVMADPIYASLGILHSGPPEKSGTATNSRINGNDIFSDNSGQLFGFYYDGSVGSSFKGNLEDIDPNDDFIIDKG